MHPDIKLGVVKLRISNMERSVSFYEQAIGLEVIRKQEATTVLGIPGSKHELLILHEVENAIITPERSASGLYHYAILVPGREELAVIMQHLVDYGVQLGQADHLVSEALYLSDPDGNGIEIYRDRPRNEWQHDELGHVNMATKSIDWQGLVELAKGKQWQGMPAGTVIGHVHFHVHDMEKAREFYCDVLGFAIEADWYRQMGALFIAAGGYHHHIGLNVWAGRHAPLPPANSTGMEYFTIIVPHAEELERIKNRLQHAGYETNHLTNGLSVKDPNGIYVQFVS